MDPVTLLIMGAVGAAAAYAIVYFLDLTFAILAQWFRNFAFLLQGIDTNTLGNAIADRIKNGRYKKAPSHLAFTLQEEMSNGQFKTVQGIFNQNSSSIYDARVVKSDSVDDTIRQAHEYGREPLVIWQ